MKVLRLLLVIFISSAIANIANSETTQDKQGNLIIQRLRSIRESFRGRAAVDSNKTKPVAAEDKEDDDDDDDSWNLGSFFGDFTTKMGSFFKGAVDNMLECVDNVFGCLNPNDDKKKNEKQKGEKPEPKPEAEPTIVPLKPNVPSSDSEQGGGAGGIKLTIDPAAKIMQIVVTTNLPTSAPATSAPATNAVDASESAVSAASLQESISTPAPASATKSTTSASTSQTTGL